jgi:hypothetical protein
MPPKKINLQKVLEYKEKGMTNVQIGKKMKVSPVSIGRALKQRLPEHMATLDTLKSFKDNKVNKLNEVQKASIDLQLKFLAELNKRDLAEEDLYKINSVLSTLAKVTGIAIDKEKTLSTDETKDSDLTKSLQEFFTTAFRKTVMKEGNVIDIKSDELPDAKTGEGISDG